MYTMYLEYTHPQHHPTSQHVPLHLRVFFLMTQRIQLMLSEYLWVWIIHQAWATYQQPHPSMKNALTPLPPAANSCLAKGGVP